MGSRPGGVIVVSGLGASELASGASIVVADRQPMFRDGIRLLLEGQPGLVIADSAATAAELNACLNDQSVDVLIIDLGFDGDQTFESIQRLRAQHAGLRTVVVAEQISTEQMVAAMRLGIEGVVLKTMPTDVIIACLRKVSSGGRWLEMKSFGDAIDRVLATQGEDDDRHDRLSEREREIMKLVGAGLKNREIAERCGITEATVKSHLSHIFEKTGVESRLELARVQLDSTANASLTRRGAE